MQKEDGSMGLLDIQQREAALSDLRRINKVVHEGMYFKIKHTYFKVETINRQGFMAVGVSRREYFDNR